MRAKRRKNLAIDPRSGLLMIILANVISFSQNYLWVEFGLIGYLAVLFLMCGKIKAGIKCCLCGCLSYSMLFTAHFSKNYCGGIYYFSVYYA